MKAIVVYYSFGSGNTRRIAEKVRAALKADIAEIEVAVPYTGTNDQINRQSKREADSGYKPALKPLAAKLSEYDIIAIGSPTWWYTMAPAVLTFISENDFHGKTVIPFITNGGWPGHNMKDIKKGCAGAVFKAEKEIQFDSTGGSKMITGPAELADWLQELSQIAG